MVADNAGWEGPTMCPDPCGFPSMDDEVLIKINAINVTAPLLCSKYAIAEMQKNEPSGGVVIRNSSVGAVMPLAVANLLPQYTPTKAYMDSLTRSIATTHAETGIKAYNVNPVAIQTEMWEKIFDEIPEYGRGALAEAGVTTKEQYAAMFNTAVAAEGSDPIIGPDAVSQTCKRDCVPRSRLANHRCLCRLRGLPCTTPMVAPRPRVEIAWW